VVKFDDESVLITHSSLAFAVSMSFGTASYGCPSVARHWNHVQGV